MVSLYKELQKSSLVREKCLPLLKNFISVKDINMIILEYCIDICINITHNRDMKIIKISKPKDIDYITIDHKLYFCIKPSADDDVYSGNVHIFYLNLSLFDMIFSEITLDEQSDSWIVMVNDKLQNLKHKKNNDIFIDISTLQDINKNDLITEWNIIWNLNVKRSTTHIYFNFCK